ncbi:acyltransferase family protein [Labedella endophytica]|uniref:Acyltransferase n=1 Tax=Labedella endophytica TaxID=1523160 RepID=A0A433JT64_9MICO|nr:acyltransferase [Labedella endophytica]RUR01207.1 acyltransferase [Labedella endophytica]
MQGRRAGLDLIRGVAIALVLLRHAWPATFGSAGIVGVVAFFALSGYLITGLLMADVERHGRVRYGRFYRHRALRLLPPMILMLAVLAVVTVVADPLGDRDGLARALLVAITYTGNLPIALGSEAIGHLWTLATEEQFYLIWPLLLSFAMRRGRVRTVVVLSAAAIAVALAVSIALNAPDFSLIYRYPASWALAMVIGAAARLWSAPIATMLPTGRAARELLGIGAVLTLGALAFLPAGKYSVWSYVLLGPIVALITGVLIHVWQDWRELPARWLRPLHALGVISYAAYLWNFPITLWVASITDAPWAPVLGIAVTIAAATISWWTVEVPARRWRRRLDERAGEIATREIAPEPAARGARGR